MRNVGSINTPDSFYRGMRLKQQLNHAKSLHDLDLAEGLGAVELPYALARKYPHAARSWEWQYIFPSPTRSLHPETGLRGRYSATRYS